MSDIKTEPTSDDARKVKQRQMEEAGMEAPPKVRTGDGSQPASAQPAGSEAAPIE